MSLIQDPNNLQKTSMGTLNNIISFAENMFGKKFLSKFNKKFQGNLYRELRYLSEKYLPQDEQDFLNKLIYQYVLLKKNEENLGTFKKLDKQVAYGPFDKRIRGLSQFFDLFTKTDTGFKIFDNVQKNMFPQTKPDTFVKKDVDIDKLTNIDFSKIDQSQLQGLSNLIDIQLQDLTLPSEKRVELIAVKDYINSGQASANIDKYYQKYGENIDKPVPVKIAEQEPVSKPTPPIARKNTSETNPEFNRKKRRLQAQETEEFAPISYETIAQQFNVFKDIIPNFEKYKHFSDNYMKYRAYYEDGVLYIINKHGKII